MRVKLQVCAIAMFGVAAGALSSKAAGADLEAGLVGEYFQSSDIPTQYGKSDAAKKPTYVRVDKQINFGNADGDFYGARMEQNFYVHWTGVIKIEKEGKYEFATESDDGSRLLIDGKQVVDNGGVHAPALKTGNVELKAGEHKIELDFFQGGGGAQCILGWTVPGGKRENVPASALFHAKGAEKIDFDEAAWKKLPEGMKDIAGHATIGGGPGVAGGGNKPPPKGNPIHEKMDYGPFLTGTLEANYPAGGNYALKGLSIKLMKVDPKTNENKIAASVGFDTEMLRYSIGWTGEWLKLDYGRDGLEGHPTLRGTPRFGTKGTSIGWANDKGEFSVKGKDDKPDDPRIKSTAGNRPEGPLPAEWGRYKGVYVDGYKTILHYTVGNADVLEQPTFDDSDGIDMFARTFQISKIDKPLTMLLIEDDKAEVDPASGKKYAGLTAKMKEKVKEDDKEKEVESEKLIATALSGAPEGVEFAMDGKRVLVKIPVLPNGAKFTIKLATINKDQKSKFDGLVNKKVTNGSDFEAVMKSGGAPRWKPIEVKGEPAKSEDELIAEAKAKLKAGETLKPEDEQKIKNSVGAYVVDTITVPYQNDYNAYMRITGVDFFKDGRAAVCTMSGDVWVVSGIDAKLEKVTWKRFATGLFASLGLKIVNDQVYTLGRDQITRFYDYNHDDEADYYECFNNDVTVGPDYHEFAHDLHTDSQGNFYFMKGSNLSDNGAMFHGTMVRVDKDGKKAEVYCKGFRAPNGMCVGPHDEITTGDNQGNWTPSSPINWIKKDGFYGFQLNQYPETKKGPRLNPLCWIPYGQDNSCGGQVWAGPNWGPLSNRLLHMSYGQSKLFEVLIEKYGDEVQGGVVKFPLNFLSGTMRARVNNADGQVYVVGMRGWQTNGVKDGVFQRMRATGKSWNAPMDVKTANNGMTITFGAPLNKTEAEDVTNWSCERFNIHYTSDYGSPEYSLEKPDQKGHDQVKITDIKLDADGKTLKVDLESVKLCTNMVFKYKIKAADGSPVNGELDYTINFIPGTEQKSPGMFPPPPKEQKKKADEKKPDDKKKDEKK